MHIIPGKEIRTTYVVKDMPEDTVEIPHMCRGALENVEDKIIEMVKGAKRNVRSGSLEYTTPEGTVFLRIRFRQKSLRLIMPGNELTFVDTHGRTKALPVSEWGEDNVEFEMKDIDQMDIVEDYLVTSLSLIDYFEPPQHDEYEDDEYAVELTDGKYDGPVVEGKPHGLGKFTWSDGSCYEGSFINGSISGNGKLTTASGDVFEGSFHNGRLAEKAKRLPKKEKEKKSAPAGSQIFTFGYIF